MGKAANSARRYERKFFISTLDVHDVEHLLKLHPHFFNEIYYPRTINNIYFDSLEFQHYFDNVVGIANRTKVRIRWYGDLLGEVREPVLEIKIKTGLLGLKERYTLAPFLMKKPLDCKIFESIFQQSELPVRLLEQLSFYKPVLLNRYQRKYFKATGEDFVVTIDSGMEVYHLKERDNLFLGSVKDRENIIVELKYPPENDHIAGEITKHFTFRMTKSSKYVSGLECLF